ncbi:MAG: protein kinase, partial [bacterium]
AGAVPGAGTARTVAGVGAAGAAPGAGTAGTVPGVGGVKPPKAQAALDKTALPDASAPYAATAASEPGVTPQPSSGATGPGTDAGEPVFSEGQHILQYELIRELGRGGMGQVFLARDTKLGRKVAIKFLTTLSEKLSDRFLVEARATARCSHENIVVIHEVNEYENQPFMVLEYLDGSPLTQLLQANRFPAARAVELMVPVVRALVRAHEFNIVHRDLKPDNIFVQSSGVLKVLDFGIAKLFSEDAGQPVAHAVDAREVSGLSDSALTREGAIMGTMLYMSPEQWGADTVDHRTDLWAVGLMLYEMVAGAHPLAGLSPQQLMTTAVLVDKPMPSVSEAVPDLSGDLERIIDRCLAKRKDQRFADAQELQDALEPLLPGRYGRQLAADESPYPGLTAFQEADAGRFFGRTKDISRTVARLRERPLLGVVGPSGVGKSSYIRAGVLPQLKASGEAWETFIVRPGRNPLISLASMLQPITRASSADHKPGVEHEELVDRLRHEPGYLGTLLRERARTKNSSILLFVDQFEELYTLVPDAEERAAYTACLAGVADDASTPLRVLISIRSDFLDRVAEDQRFMEDLTRGLIFLQPPDRSGLREAITQPLDMVSYRFENLAVVEEMLDELENTPGALPLLQFTAAKLWETRDSHQRMLREDSFHSMGGVGGALAAHADEVLSSLSPDDRKLVRSIFVRLVTSDGTRAIVDVAELRELSGNTGEVQRLVDYLVEARLLVVQTRTEAEGPAVEIVHESLITGWPLLKRWLDESQEHAAFLEQLRSAAKQWEAKGRAQGLLWRGEAEEEARRFERRYQGQLPGLQREYLDAVFDLATRASRRRRAVVTAIISILLVLVVVAGVALVWIRNAEQTARQAERKVKRQLTLIQRKEREKAAAQKEASQAKKQVATGQQKLQKTQATLDMSKEQLRIALTKAQAESLKAQAESKRAKEQKTRAEKATVKARENERKAREATDQVRKMAETERQAKERIKKLWKKEQERVRKLLRQRKKITTDLD